MWEYNIETVTLINPKDDDFVIVMDGYGMDNWEIFSFKENIERRVVYSDVFSDVEITVEYKIYMKRRVEDVNID